MHPRSRFSGRLTDFTDWFHAMASWLIPAIAGKDASGFPMTPPDGTPEQDIRIIADLIFSYLQ
ncbi:MAG: hypothetical protein ABSB59_23885 [Streptosporangiaceae bacterium]|jgi:hypothetical protein